MAKEISVRIKFFSGIDKELKLSDYDPAVGILMKIPSGKRLKWALKHAGMTSFSGNAFFRSGSRIFFFFKQKTAYEISCLKPSGGG